MKKIVVLFFTLTIALFSLSSIASANADVPRDVKKQVEADFETYKISLDNDKEHFGLSKQDDAINSVLGQGYPYYVVSKNYLSNTSSELFSFAGYIFQIKVGSKSAGIVFAEQQEGVWKVASIKSDLTLEQEVEGSSGLSISKSSNQPYFLVYDESFKIVALTDGNNSFVPIKNNKILSLEKNNVLTIKDIGEQIKAQYESNNGKATKSGSGGFSTNVQESKSSMVPWIFAGGAVIILGLVVIRVQGSRRSK